MSLHYIISVLDLEPKWAEIRWSTAGLKNWGKKNHICFCQIKNKNVSAVRHPLPHIYTFIPSLKWLYHHVWVHSHLLPFSIHCYLHHLQEGLNDKARQSNNRLVPSKDWPLWPYPGTRQNFQTLWKFAEIALGWAGRGLRVFAQRLYALSSFLPCNVRDLAHQGREEALFSAAANALSALASNLNTGLVLRGEMGKNPAFLTCRPALVEVQLAKTLMRAAPWKRHCPFLSNPGAERIVPQLQAVLASGGCCNERAWLALADAPLYLKARLVFFSTLLPAIAELRSAPPLPSVWIYKDGGCRSGTPHFSHKLAPLETHVRQALAWPGPLLPCARHACTLHRQGGVWGLTAADLPGAGVQADVVAGRYGASPTHRTESSLDASPKTCTRTGWGFQAGRMCPLPPLRLGQLLHGDTAVPLWGSSARSATEQGDVR